MQITHSADGTPIAFDRTGDGPSLVLVVGALCTRQSTKALAPLLAGHFTVYEYDRRGRGESGDTPPYAVEREVEDLDAVIAEAGGTALVYGHSSGAALALEAAAHGSPIAKLAVFEPPYGTTAEDEQRSAELAAVLDEAVAAGRRKDAVVAWMTGTGAPAAVVQAATGSPGWADLEAVALTLPYDLALARRGAGDGRFDAIHTPTLVLSGELSPPFLRAGSAAAAAAVPGARSEVIGGQDHGVDDEVLARRLTSWFG